MAKKNTFLIKALYLVLLSIVITSCDKSTNEKEGFFLAADSVGVVSSSTLDEISGVVASSLYEGYLWVHNDSGDKAKIYLINTNGDLVVTVTVSSITNRDWEDMTYNDGYLYISETGDNDAEYRYKMVYKVKEPIVDTSALNQTMTTSEVETMTFRFSDKIRDCETLMYDPITSELVFITKRESSNLLYTTPFIVSTESDDIQLEPQATINTTLICGGDISPDGSEVVIKNYTNIYYWKRSGTQPLSELLTGKYIDIPYTIEPQGESICWSTDGRYFYTISEENHNISPIVYLYRR